MESEINNLAEDNQQSLEINEDFEEINQIDTDNEDFQDAHESFALDLKEINNMLPTVLGTNNVHNISTEASKEKLFNLKNIILIQKDILRIYEGSNKDGSLNLAINTIKNRIKDLTSASEEQELGLKNISTLKSEFKEKLPSPVYGTETKIDIERARLMVPAFGNTKGQNLLSQTGVPIEGVSLEEFWHKFTLFIESEKLNEEATKNLLAALMFGAPYKVYFDNKEKNVKEILQILIDRFGTLDTIADKLKSLECITRLEGEKLVGCLNRCSILIDATKYIVPENEREMRYNVLMTQNLLKLAKQKAKAQMLAHRATAARAGYNLSYKELLNIAIDSERVDNTSDDSLYAYPAEVKRKFRSHAEKPYNHTSVRFKDQSPPPQKPTKSLQDIPVMRNPTIPNYARTGEEFIPSQRPHLFDQPFSMSRKNQTYNQPKYNNQNYEYDNYNHRYNKSNRHDRTFVQRLDNNQLYQSIPMGFGCPNCGYQSKQTGKYYRNYSKN